MAFGIENRNPYKENCGPSAGVAVRREAARESGGA